MGISGFEIAIFGTSGCIILTLSFIPIFFITKSKPPRLESKEYSTSLKESVKPRLDESISGMLASVELLDCKFINKHINSPISISILKELGARNLLFKDKYKKDSKSESHVNDIGQDDIAASYNSDNNLARKDNNKETKVHSNANNSENVGGTSQDIDDINVK